MVAAYATAGPNTLASCWLIAPMFFPPLGVLLVGIAGYSMVFLALSVFRGTLRQSIGFPAAVHGMILTVGLIACWFAASESAGQVACL